MNDTPFVSVTRHGRTVVLTLADPRVGNALSARLVADLRAAFAALEGGDARAVVLTGEGDNFCTGAHLGEMAGLADAGEAERLADAARLGDLYGAMLRCPLVTVAAVQGAAFGGGLGLAAACDLVVAAPDVRLQFSEARLGFVPALISVFLPRRISLARLAGLFLDPAPMDAATAQAAGLVDEVTADPLAFALERAEAIAGKAAPSAVAATKRLLLDLHLPDLDARLAHAARVNAAQRVDPDCRRGVAHFLAHRSFPDWSAEG